MVDIKLALTLGGLALVVLFRNQIGAALASTGKSLGAGLGGAAGAALGSTVSGFSSAFTSTLPPWLKTETGEFRPLLGTKEEFEGGISSWWSSLFPQSTASSVVTTPAQPVPSAPLVGTQLNWGIQTPDSIAPQPDQTVTPYTREFSDTYTRQSGRTPAQVLSSLDPNDPRRKGLEYLIKRG